MAASEPRYYPGKAAVSAVAVVQLTLATALFVDNSLVLHTYFADFYHHESRLVVAAIWAFALSWLLLTVALLLAVITNRPSLILPHIAFSVLWLCVNLVSLVVLFAWSARMSTLLATSTTTAVLAVSIPCEWHCYRLMRLLM